MMASFDRTQATGEAPGASRVRRGLFAVLAALALCAVALAPSGTAHAADDQIQVSVPTTVPTHVMTDGTVVGPSPDTWAIRNDGSATARLSSVSATDVYDRLTISAAVNGEIDPFFTLENGQPATRSIDVAANSTVQVDWKFSKLDPKADADLLARSAQGPVEVANLSLSFKRAEEPVTAFAVYSADDNSLNFYKRSGVPTAGSQFEGKDATEVYRGVEDGSFGQEGCPWHGLASGIESVKFVDEGIQPASLANWFDDFDHMTSCDVSKLDTSKATDMSGMFDSCSALASLDVSGFKTSSMTDMSGMFSGCFSLAALDLTDFDTSNVTNTARMFAYCGSLSSLDLSGFDMGKATDATSMFFDCSGLKTVTLGDKWKWVGEDPYLPAPSGEGADGKWYDSATGQGYAPADVPAGKAATYVAVSPTAKTAFAVYSADDNSLNFYKRSGVPTAGSQFEGKTATEVYQGIETARYPSRERPWVNHTGEIKSVKFVDDGVKPATMSYWFLGFGNMTECDLSKIDTSSVDGMTSMFYGCSGLTSLDVSKFDTSNVTSMVYMFGNCSGLTSLDVSKFDTSNVTSMSYMFYGCSGLTSLDLSSFDMSNVASARGMFQSCNKLAEVTLGDQWKWVGTDGYLPAPSRDAIPDADGKWYDIETGEAYAPADIPTGKAGTYVAAKSAVKVTFAVYSRDDDSLDFYRRSGVPRDGEQFEGKIATQVYTGFETATYGVGESPWHDRVSEIKSVEFVDDGIKPTSLAYWFFDLWFMTECDLSKLDTSNATSMSGMFGNCSSLASLDLSKFDTSKVTDMSSMFQSCSSLASLDVSGFKTSNVTKMSGMFRSCSSLTTLDLSKLDSSKVTSAEYMFQGCSSLASLDLSGFDMSNATSMSYMFENCFKLAEVTLGDQWKWVGTNGYLPAPSSYYIPGADGNWYDSATGQGYAPAEVPAGKAATYVAVKKPAEKTAFAVYSEDDNSLNFYKRSDVPTAGSQFDGKTATAVYPGVEDGSFGQDGCPWYELCNDVVSVAFVDEGIQPASLANWFSEFGAMTSCDVSKLDTSKATDMSGMFDSCELLNSLDVSGFDTSNVMSMSAMFQDCMSLTSLDVSGFDTSNVTNMVRMFAYCDELASLDLSKFDMEKVTDATDMFFYCSGLKTVKLGDKWKWAGEDPYLPLPSGDGADGKWYDSATGQGYAPAEVPAGKAATYVAVYAPAEKTAFAVYSETDHSLNFYKRTQVPTAGDRFEGKEATAVYMGIEKDSYADSSAVPWKYHVGEIEQAAVVDEGLAPASLANWFYAFDHMTSCDLSKLVTSNATSMNGMFGRCYKLTSLDVSKFDTSKVTGMSDMFESCYNLTSLDVSKFNTTNVTSMRCMFWNCSKLTSLDVSKFDTSNATTISKMFWNCYSLESLDLSGFDASNVLDVSDMFERCNKLAEVTLGENWKWVGTSGYLPAPLDEYIPGADGKWYDSATGRGYEPADVPGGKAGTYVAVKPAPTAFAVYSEDDGSLNFYKRSEVPSKGDQFEGKDATEVYRGVEDGSFGQEGCPWHGLASGIESVAFVDEGIQPASLANWFDDFDHMTSCDVSKLDTSKATDMSGMFDSCSALASLDVSGFKTSSVTDMSGMFSGCFSLAALDLTDFDASNVTDVARMFAYCGSLSFLDLSGFDMGKATDATSMFFGCSSLKTVTLGDKWKWVGEDPYLPAPSSEHIPGADGKWYDIENGEAYAPADVPVGELVTYVAVPPAKNAFAVYSETDHSLNFYKRTQVPTAGDQFEGKTATAVYAGIEKDSYADSSAVPWKDHAGEIEQATVVDEGLAPASLANWFYAFEHMTSCDLSKLVTSNATSMSGMFGRCFKLTSLDLSNFDTSKVTDMSSMFENCDSLTFLDVSNFDTSNVTSMYAMFWDCSSQSLDLTNFDTSKVTNMNSMFGNCSSQSLDLTNFDTSNVTDMTMMFYGCRSQSLDLSSFDMTQGTNTTNMFYNCLLEKVVLGDKWQWNGNYLPAPSSYIPDADGNWYDFDTGEAYAPAKILPNKAATYVPLKSAARPVFAVYSADDKSLDFYRRGDVPTKGRKFQGKTATEIYKGFIDASYDDVDKRPWNNRYADIRSVKFVDEGIQPASLANWFNSFTAMTSCDLSKLDTSNVTSMYALFYNCPKLTSLDVSKFDTRNVANMNGMFGSCSGLTSLDVSGFDTSKVADMANMFYNCPNLTSLDLSNLDTSNVTNMDSMFYDCSSLTSLDVSKFDTRNVTSMYAMFYDCRSLTSLDVSGFDTRNATRMDFMFGCCYNLRSLDVSGFDTSKVTDMTNMFFGCSLLTSLDLSSFDMAMVKKTTGMFGYCSDLKTVTLGDKWRWVGTDGYLPAPLSEYIPGADGKWYNPETGEGYAPNDVPGGAGTYVSVQPAKGAFAVYSADDGSLDFYNRSGVPIEGHMFRGKTVTEVYKGFETATYAYPDQRPWNSRAAEVKSVEFVDAGIKPISLANWFNDFKAMESCDLSNLCASDATSMESMFWKCGKLTSLDVSQLDTRNVISMSYMFGYCTRLTSLDISSFNTSNVTSMFSMFNDCSSLTSLDVSGLDTSNVKRMDFMFDRCSSLASLDVSSFDMAKVLTAKCMFHKCSGLNTVTLGDKWKWVGEDPYLPLPSGDGADGKWYALSDGKGYAPEEVPGNKADTYYASQGQLPETASSTQAMDDDAQAPAPTGDEAGAAAEDAADTVG